MSVVGFDFGSQTSFCAIARQGGIEVVANEYSKRATETVVSLGDKQRFMGTAGNEKRISKIKSTVLNFKRLIGLPFEHPEVQELVTGKFPAAYKIVKDEATGLAAVDIPGEGTYTITQVAAMFLGKMKEISDTNLGRSTEDCVITCPVFYGEEQRRALQDAAAIAGLRPLQIMSETTAAALAYGIYKQDLPEAADPSRNVVFVDFGFNSLQVTTAAMNKGKLTILGSAYDKTLGGSNFDKVIWQYMNDAFVEKYKVDTTKNIRALVKLVEACEKTKKTMSANAIDIPLNLECLMDDKDVNGKINRDQFHELAAPLLERIKATLVQGLAASGLKKEDLYSVEIIGGASRMPCFKDAVKAVFGLDPSTTLNTDEAAARGAALKCAILSPTFRVREFNIVDSVINEITIAWANDATGTGGGDLKIFAEKNPFPYTKALTIHRKSTEKFEISAKLTGAEGANRDLGKAGERKKVKLYFRMDGSALFQLSAAEQLERYEEWVEEPVEPVKGEEKPAEEKPKEDAPKEAGDEKMDTDKDANTSQDGEKMETDTPKEEEPEMQKVRKVRQRKLALAINTPFQLGSLPTAVLNKYLEIECELRSKDKEERDKSDARNALEELGYAIRDRLYARYDGYVQEEEKSNLSKTCDELEDWLYGDGEDEAKGVYVERKNVLEALVQPIENRVVEFTKRPAALEKLTATLNKYQKICGEVEAQVPESKYLHLAPEDIKKMNDALAEGWGFFNRTQSALKGVEKHQDASVTSFDIESKSNYIENLCKPIASKKPPKVEPPKEEEKKEEAPAAEEKKEEKMEADPAPASTNDDLD
ncbi:Oidioi.mRNA.OKI2018_I69.PAR.g11284.t1.cds [Oikopleura dioica]|uniref:Oidioi.mRNA.OKI2018_I69.PAR.g11284.t1.cds n=1 Tax=Oikopleura dioica TaxID=34765 RepID=A0ABN7RV03_OIKDI|nr:Oidioi.mRNA.OKI2018_I69.PAR.g11284.t1.cds [Oikopleura dioica]